MSVPPQMLARCRSRLDAAVDVVVAVGGQRTAGGEDGPERGEIVGAPGLEPLLLRQRQILRARAEDGHPLVGRHRPEDVGRRERRPVEQHDRGAGREPRDQPVPHHPAAGGEVEQSVVRSEVGVQHQLLEVLQQRAAGSVHHALGQSGRAGRVQDVQRVIEREASVGGLIRAPGGVEHRIPAARARDAARGRVSGSGTARRRRAGSRAAGHTPPAPGRANRSPCRRSGSRPRRPAPWARSGRTGRARRWRRSRASTTTRARPGWPPPAWRSRFPEDSAGSRRRGRRRPRPWPETRRPRPRLRGAAPDGSAPLPAPLVPEHQRVPLVVVPQEILGEVEPRAGKPAGTEHRVGRRHPVERRPPLGPTAHPRRAGRRGLRRTATPRARTRPAWRPTRRRVRRKSVTPSAPGGRRRRTSARKRVRFARATRSGAGVQMGPGELSTGIQEETAGGSATETRRPCGAPRLPPRPVRMSAG